MKINFNRAWKTLLVSVSFLFPAVVLMGMKSGDDDWIEFLETDFEAQALAVNEGTLEFLTEPPEKIPPVLQNKLTITPQSMVNGWVDMLQCHEHIDSVAEAQVLYHPKRTRDINIINSQNIGRSWVEDNSVQLENVGKDAKLCVQAKVKALYSNFNGSYSMRNGPFLRKFLDGYYPMRVTMEVSMPAGLLGFEAINPQEQAGFDVRYDENSMNIEALFVGALEIEVYFTDLSAESDKENREG